jgi:hypothetical protein
VLSGRGFCDKLITRPEESYQLWCVVCDLENTHLVIEEGQGPLGSYRATRKKKYVNVAIYPSGYSAINKIEYKIT